MQRNLSHIAAMAFNEPLLLEPAYARVFFCALGKELGAGTLSIPQQSVTLDASGMQLALNSFMEEGKQPARFYQVNKGIAVLPVTGTLVHKLGAMRPFSGMTGYDGIIARLQQAVDDPEVQGILLDIDSPGGQAAGAFDCADLIARLGEQKPIWALCNDMACSAAMLLASACSQRWVTQTSMIGSIGVLMAHTSYEKQLEQVGVDITLIYSGDHKVEGNPTQALPESVRADFQRRIDDARALFAGKVAKFTGLSVDDVMATEAATYQGQAGIDIGLADGMVNSADAVDMMAMAMKNKRGVPMGVENMTATEAAAQENQRVMGILRCEEAKGREQLAHTLAMQPGMSVEQAQAILAAAPSVTGEHAPQSLSEQILACEEAKGRETLAQALAATPGMTVDQARGLLMAAPQKGSDEMLLNTLLSCDEAKGREKLAETLAAEPGMTVEKAQKILASAPTQAPSQDGVFDRFMATHAEPSVKAAMGGSGTPEEVMLHSIPGTTSTRLSGF